MVLCYNTTYETRRDQQSKQSVCHPATASCWRDFLRRGETPSDADHRSDQSTITRDRQKARHETATRYFRLNNALRLPDDIQNLPDGPHKRDEIRRWKRSIRKARSARSGL